MARKSSNDLFSRVKSLAGRGSSKAPQNAVGKITSGLSGAVTEIQDRLAGGSQKRKAAGKKAARTRRLRAKARSDAAKRGARTRRTRS